MGNKCPSGFQNSPANPGVCVHECDTTKGLSLQVRNGTPSCVYTARPEIAFALSPAPALSDAMIERFPTVDSLPPNFSVKIQYARARDKYTADLALASQSIDRETQLADAFRDLQRAENVRDQSPQAYQDARIRYYTLLKGERWIDEEKERLLRSEVAPTIASYMASYQDMTVRQAQQQRTMDVVRSVKDKILSLKDDFKLTTNVFGKQIADLKSQIQLEKRKGLEQTKEFQSWIDFVVNILLIVFAIAAIIAIVRKLRASPATSTYTATPSTS